LASIPFFCLMVLALVVVVLFPQIATWLPDTLIGVTKK
jgi:TRAP-type C4-dicarboxylate transport system permease large subunit